MSIGPVPLPPFEITGFLMKHHPMWHRVHNRMVRDAATTQVKPRVYTKKHINKRLRAAVWTKYNGSVFSSPCFACHLTEINVFNFVCAHVVAEALNGPTTLPNLRPTCNLCNAASGKQNLGDFVRTNQFTLSRMYVENKELT
jgi:hypothetical protein